MAQCPAASSASSITTFPVADGSRKMIFEPPCPVRQVSLCNFTFLAFSSAIALSMSSTSKQM